MNRTEYLDRAKQRAIKYWEAGDYLEAVTSMMSDLSQHPDLKNHSGLAIGDAWFLAPAMHRDADFVRRFILGFK
jgi:hypothetical protein